MSKSSYNTTSSPPPSNYDPNPPTFAAFAPTTNSGYSATAKQRSTVIVHKKSPLLVATPPQITRTLAHSHPYILPLNKLAGLLSWSTGDAWESFLLVAAFWAVCLYGSYVVRYATPLNAVIFLILGMYSRRYSPLSSTSSTGEKHDPKTRRQADPKTPQHKSLDEIVETMNQFTSRCNVLLDPFLTMTDFLSTQRTPTSATTRPALTTLLIRIILVTPLWVGLTLPPLYILTPQRTIIAIGTIILTWHSRPAKVSRVILWRSMLVRRICAFTTGLDFDVHPASTSLIKSVTTQKHSADVLAGTKRRPDPSGIRFTFVLYENQRRWIGLGWTTSMFGYERSPWTDEHLNPAPSKDEFELPEVEGRSSRWRWIKGSKWQIDSNNIDSQKPKSGTSKTKPKTETDPAASDDNDRGGWIFYDNKWNDGRVEDGWGRYTRRRKWFRDAELVEVTPSMEATPAVTPFAQSDADTEDEKQEMVRKAKAFGKSLSPVIEGEKVDLGDSVATIVPDTTSKLSTPSKGISTSKDDDSTSTKTASTKRRSWFTRTSSYNKSIDHSTAVSGAPLAATTNTTEEREQHRGASGSGSKIRDRSTSMSGKSKARSDVSSQSRDGPENDVLDRWRDNNGSSKVLGMGEDVYMGLG